LPSNLSENVNIKRYGTVILRVVYFVCDTWSVTLREEHRLGAQGERLFGSVREDVGGSWRKLRNKFRYLHSSPNVIIVIKSRKIYCTERVVRTKETRSAYKIHFGKPEGKRSLGRLSGSWEDNIKMGPKEIVCEDVE
jgi:hypothetical protein